MGNDPLPLHVRTLATYLRADCGFKQGGLLSA